MKTKNAGYSFCHTHHKRETYNFKPYQICFECKHVYRTRFALVKAYWREGNWERRMPWRTLIHVLLVPSKIFFCQECLHDF